MKKTLSIVTGCCLVSLTILGLAQQTPAKHAQQFTPPDVLTVSDIPYPLATVAAGVVTLAVNLDSAGKVLNIQILRDIPTVTSQTTVALQSWTYAPATSNGKHVPSILMVNIVFDPAFLDTNNIPLAPPDSSQSAKAKSSYTPPQLFTATFPPYPTNGSGSGAVVLDVTVDRTGNISQVTPIRDVPTLTAAAVAALKKWSFNAATYANTPTTSKVVVAMVFRSPAAALP